MAVAKASDFADSCAMVIEMDRADGDGRSISSRLEDAERAAVYGVARIAGSFASDLAEAIEAARLLATALEAHVALHGDPDGELGRALAAAEDGFRRLRSPAYRARGSAPKN